MSWIAGSFFLEAGQSVRISFDWDGKYMGTQFALARPETLPFGPFLESPGVWEVQTADHGLIGERRSDGPDIWTYVVTVRNPGSHAAVLQLTGGAV